MNGLIQLPNGAHAFIDGAPSSHVCNDEKGIILLENGERLEDTEENIQKHSNEIRGGSAVCSICGSAAIDRAFWEFDF